MSGLTTLLTIAAAGLTLGFVAISLIRRRR
jgi:hypothetical protein